MTLDLNKLSTEEIILLNKISIDVQEEFNEVTRRILDSTNKNLAWLLHPLVGRNIYQSNFFINVCYIVLVKDIVEKQHDIKRIIVKNKIQAKVLKKHYGKKIKIISPNKEANILLTILRSFAGLIFKILMEILSRNKRRIREFSLKNIILIDTFVLSNSLKEGRYIDRYYNGLLDSVNEKDNIYWIPTIIGKYNKIQLDNIVKNSEEKIIFRQDYLKLIDYIKALWKLFTLKFPERNEFSFYNLDIKPLIHSEFIRKKFNTSIYGGTLNYYFIKRLKQAGASLKLLIDWNENQPIDKGLIKGVRTFLPDVYIKGYQGFIVSFDNNFYIQPTAYEIDNGVIPDEICVVGKGLENNIKRFSKNIKVTTAPAFRFANVYKNFERKDHSKRIMVALPIGLNENMDIMSLIYDALKDRNNDFEIWIKPHPVLNTEKLKGILGNKWRQNYIVVNGDFSESVSQVDLLIGSTSSTLVETLARGIPVVVIGSQNGITQNPVPKTINQRIWRIAYTPDELNESIKHFTELTSEEKKELEFLGEKIREDYFELPTKENVEKFIKI